jgi:hypothetical protein
MIFWYKLRIFCTKCAPKCCPRPLGFDEEIELAVKKAEEEEREFQEQRVITEMVLVDDEKTQESQSSFPTSSKKGFY